MKTVIIGANGQLGSDLVKVMSDWELIPLTHKDIEICDYSQTRSILTEFKPKAVINTAAYHKVDECEDNISKTFEVNTFAVRNLAQVCHDLDCILVHLSTDYVFGGDKTTPFTEEDLPNPLNIYGISKLDGEYFVRNICPKHFIIRTSGLFGVAGASGKGGNFIEMMIRFAREERPIRVVDDQFLAPTYTRDLAVNMKLLIETNKYGLYHITNQGEYSWYEFTKMIFELCKIHAEVTPTSSATFKAKAVRPRYSVLGNFNLSRLKLDNMSDLKSALRNYLELKNHL